MNKKTLILFLVLGLHCSLGNPDSDQSTSMMAKKFAQEQLSKSYLKGGIWDRNFLHHHPEIAIKLEQYDEGKLCSTLKNIQTANVADIELSRELKSLGYKCYQKPLTVDPKAFPLQYLKKDGSNTPNAHEIDVVWQRVCVEVKEGCVVRIKMDGFPKSKRPAPHSTKALLLDQEGDASSYDNEAFKVTSSGAAVPKGPEARFGLAPGSVF